MVWAGRRCPGKGNRTTRVTRRVLLDGDHGPRVKAVDLPAQLGLEQVERVVTGAVGGVDLRNLFEYALVRFLVKVEAADDCCKLACVLCLCNDVANTPVRTAGYQHGTRTRIYEKGDLIGEGVGNHTFVAANQQMPIVCGEWRIRRKSGENGDPRNKGLAVLHNAKSVCDCIDGLVIKPNLAKPRLLARILRNRGIRTNEYCSPASYRCNRGKSANVIDVPVGDHDCICY